MYRSARILGFFVCIVVVAGMLCLATGTWHYEITSDSWNIDNEAIWTCWGGTKPKYNRSACFPSTNQDGRFHCYCHDDDPSIPDHIELEIRIMASVLDAGWRSWLTLEELDEAGAQGLDLLASLHPKAVWIQIFRCGEIPTSFSGSGTCSEWKISDWSDNAHVFANGTLLLGLPSDTEIVGSFKLYLEEYGCDSWNDGGIYNVGRLVFRCWLE